MVVIVMNNDVRLINERLEALFKPKFATRYGLVVVNDPYERSYNVFFNSQRAGQRLKSTPLHRITDYKLESLELIIRELQKKTQLTIQFVGFTKQRWPQSQRIIQYKRGRYE